MIHVNINPHQCIDWSCTACERSKQYGMLSFYLYCYHKSITAGQGGQYVRDLRANDFWANYRQPRVLYLQSEHFVSFATTCLAFAESASITLSIFSRTCLPGTEPVSNGVCNTRLAWQTHAPGGPVGPARNWSRWFGVRGSRSFGSAETAVSGRLLITFSTIHMHQCWQRFIVQSLLFHESR